LGPSWHRPYHNPDDWHASIAPPPALLQQRRGSPSHRGPSEEYANLEPTHYPYVASQPFRSDSRGWIDSWRDGPRSAVQDIDVQSQATIPHLHQSSAYQHHHSGSEYPSYSNQSEHVFRAFQHLEIRNPSVSIARLLRLSVRQSNLPDAMSCACDCPSSCDRHPRVCSSRRSSESPSASKWCLSYTVCAVADRLGSRPIHRYLNRTIARSEFVRRHSDQPSTSSMGPKFRKYRFRTPFT
jgi:hypothetical protein